MGSACCYSGCCCFQLSLTKSFGSCTPSCSYHLQITIGRWRERVSRDLPGNRGALNVLRYADYSVPIQGAEGCPLAVGTSRLSWRLMFLRATDASRQCWPFALRGCVVSPGMCRGSDTVELFKCSLVRETLPTHPASCLCPGWDQTILHSHPSDVWRCVFSRSLQDLSLSSFKSLLPLSRFVSTSLGCCSPLPLSRHPCSFRQHPGTHSTCQKRTAKALEWLLPE